MSNTEKIWFTSDIHFGHDNIIKFCPDTRKYADADQMDRAIIKRWQEQVDQNDHVYVLGDVFFLKAEPALRVLKQLPGQKHLILGNHDKVIRENITLRDEFVSVDEYKEVDIDGIKVVMFHFPIHSWNKMYQGSFHLYGHTHGKYASPNRAMDIGVDTRADNGLWSWEEVKRELSNRTPA